MSEITFEPTGDEEAGEFILPHLPQLDAEAPEDERDRYDEQILAGLVSP